MPRAKRITSCRVLAAGSGSTYATLAWTLSETIGPQLEFDRDPIGIVFITRLRGRQEVFVGADRALEAPTGQAAAAA